MIFIAKSSIHEQFGLTQPIMNCRTCLQEVYYIIYPQMTSCTSSDMRADRQTDLSIRHEPNMQMEQILDNTFFSTFPWNNLKHRASSRIVWLLNCICRRYMKGFDLPKISAIGVKTFTINFAKQLPNFPKHLCKEIQKSLSYASFIFPTKQ